MGRKVEIFSGFTSNYLTAIELDVKRNEEQIQKKEKGEIKKAKIYWLCRCDFEGCGNIKSIEESHLKHGDIKSCGCYSQKLSAERGRKRIKTNKVEEFEDFLKVWDFKEENYFIIDKIDKDLLENRCWGLKDKDRNNNYWMCVERGSEGKRIMLHQEIAKRIDPNYVPSKSIIPDHLGSDLVKNKEDDNRRCSIRIVDRHENNKNHKTQSNNTSGKQGVNWLKAGNCWIARIYDNNHKRIHKCFKNFEDAVTWRVEKEKEFGYIGE